MKKYLLAVLLLAGCQEKKFHIRVQKEMTLRNDIYTIEFTQTTWKEGVQFINPTGQSLFIYFYDADAAIEFASRFKTYDACIQFNDSVVRNLNAIKLKEWRNMYSDTLIY